MVPTPLPYAPRTVGLARGPSIQRRVLAPWLSWGPRGPGIGFVVSDLGRPRVPPQRPARRIARGKRLIGRLVDFQVVRGGLLFRQLGLGVRLLVGHRNLLASTRGGTWPRPKVAKGGLVPDFAVERRSKRRLT